MSFLKTPPLRAALALASAILAFPATALADTTVPGFAFGPSRPVGVSDAYATLPDGNRVRFDGNAMQLVAEDGTLLLPLGSTAAFEYPSFVLPDPTSTYALIGESTNGTIYKVDLGGAGATPLVDLDYNYDAVFEDAGHVLVSAATCGFNCGNGIFRVDVATGARRLVGRVGGPSGPLARAANGDLYYGSQPDIYPPPPSPILRWTAAQVASGTVLTDANATVFVPPIHPASSMKFDPVFGHLFVASAAYNLPDHVLEIDANGTVVASIVENGIEFLSGIEVLATQGPGALQAFQPRGRVLSYRATSFVGMTPWSEIRRLEPRRARATTSGPGLVGPGAVTFRVTGAHPSSSVLVVVGLRSTYDPVESSYDMGSFLLHTGIDLATARNLTSVPTDGAGVATFTFQNPGGLQGTRVLQGWVRDGNGFLTGTSTSAFN